MRIRIRTIGRTLGQALARHPNTIVFVVGFTTFAVSVAQWSAPLAGVIAGVVLMLVAAWPFVAVHRRGE